MTTINYIPIELEGTVYNLVTDVVEVDWDGKESEDDLTGYYGADVLYFIMQDSQLLAAYKEDFEAETLQYINDFVDPI